MSHQVVYLTLGSLRGLSPGQCWKKGYDLAQLVYGWWGHGATFDRSLSDHHGTGEYAIRVHSKRQPSTPEEWALCQWIMEDDIAFSGRSWHRSGADTA